MHIAPRHRRIILYLMKSEKKQTTRQIQEALELKAYTLLTKDLKDLTKEKFIRKHPGPVGNSFAYTFNNSATERVRELSSKAASNTSIQFYFKRFANDPSIKLSTLAWKLPDSYRRLFQAALDVSLGSPVGDELLEVKKDLEKLQELAGNFHGICGGLLDNPVIWDSVKFAEYILEDEDPDEIKELLDDFQQLSGD